MMYLITCSMHKSQIPAAVAALAGFQTARDPLGIVVDDIEPEDDDSLVTISTVCDEELVQNAFLPIDGGLRSTARRLFQERMNAAGVIRNGAYTYTYATTHGMNVDAGPAARLASHEFNRDNPLHPSNMGKPGIMIEAPNGEEDCFS